MTDKRSNSKPLIAIACGGTGGHLFPGVAVGEELAARGCDVMLIVSEKDIDKRAAAGARNMEVVSLPAVGLGRNPLRFLAGTLRSRRAILRRFRARRPAAVLGMGGFTCAAPILAGRKVGATTFLHESNTIPGRANRWLGRWIDQAFVWFPEAAKRWPRVTANVVGMPVREAFRSRDRAGAREALGLDPERPTLVVTGGSQGASAVNRAVLAAIPKLTEAIENLQILHLTGAADREEVAARYAKTGVTAVTHAFLDDMPAALNAATLVAARAGASSMAELAAVGAPAILVPYPHAADDHQSHNAAAFVACEAARLVEQNESLPEALEREICELMTAPQLLQSLSMNVRQRHEPDAARRIAERVMAKLTREAAAGSAQPADHKPEKGPLAERFTAEMITDRGEGAAG